MLPRQGVLISPWCQQIQGPQTSPQALVSGPWQAPLLQSLVGLASESRPIFGWGSRLIHAVEHGSQRSTILYTQPGPQVIHPQGQIV